MEDYQILIDHAWSLDPDLFSLFREHFQIHLNKRRSTVEFQGKITEGYRQLPGAWWPHWVHLRQRRMPARDILPRKIARDKQPRPAPSQPPSLPLRRPDGTPLQSFQPVTPIEIIHPSQYSIAGLYFEPFMKVMFNMNEIREVCMEFGWEIPDPLNEATKPRPYVRALMELEG